MEICSEKQALSPLLFTVLTEKKRGMEQEWKTRKIRRFVQLLPKLRETKLAIKGTVRGVLPPPFLIYSSGVVPLPIAKGPSL